MPHTKLQASEPSGFEGEIVECFSMYFFGSNLRLQAQGHLEPWDLHLNKIGKRPLGNATYQFQSSEPSDIEEDF